MAPTYTEERASVFSPESSLLQLVEAGRFDQSVPSMSRMSPLEMRVSLRVKGRETSKLLRRELRDVQRMLRVEELEAEREAKIIESTISTYDDLARAIMLVAKGERNPDFYTVDAHSKLNKGTNKGFETWAEESLMMTYSLREFGVLRESTITNAVFKYIREHWDPNYNPRG